MNQLNCMRAFLAVADSRSFSEAARRTGTSGAMVSRRIGALESHLGIRLFNRSTRRVELSEAGSRYYPRCRELVEQLDVVDAEISGLGHAPSGHLRVSVPMDFGQLFLQPAIRAFLSRHPEIRMEVRFDDRHVDLIREQVDVAIRISQLPDSSLVSRKLGQACLGCYASPDYLAQHGEPAHPDQLRGHSLLDYTLARTPGRWQFEGDGQPFEVAVRGQLAANIRSAPLDISMVYLHRQFRPAAIGAFTGFLDEYFRDNPGWQPRPA
jgi:DNA-binding transcriptional LysR family regulator